ncbi:hypothetical protein K504DRAFT_74723 [Pleomassaria siparia CBS 279.74]|uniref:Mediator of RNA polymerase II transcription subunit 1 n=1 Tax=Pleomassaria siparia CBS 279.74 TaxID=1314801 RepID=A0A6G1K088_9PLEO|nr:hypothetical protein K504DRAFT_74723 [Pleomassaria siparia CBS 279.74]
MATPTPFTKTPQKHPQAFSSPIPRSVPPMMNFDSPSVMTLLQEGGIGMGISMSGMGMSSLGLSASAMGRADEDERRRRLENIIATLKTKPGRVSEEGIIGLCKKEGLDVEREEMPDGTISLALVIGSEVMCDVFVRNGEIESVKLETAIDRERPGLDFGPTGSKILLQSLSPLPGMTKINLTLERFSHNLDKLLRMDKLSAPENGGVSCYQAIFGVYTSLKKLFEHEKKMALAVLEAHTPYASQKAEREVLCKKSGRPRINAGTCLGLSLEYWMDRRHLIPRTLSKQSTSAKGKEKMNVDSSSDGDNYPEDGDPSNNKIYALTIECESSPSSMYSPIRISDAWISDSIEKAPDVATGDIDNILSNTPSIDWLDPPPTYLPSVAAGGDHDAMSLDAAPGRLPNIRFVAQFNPPLVVPLTVFINIYQTLGLEVPQDIRATTFTGLALRPGEPDPGLEMAGDSTPEVRSEKTVLVLNSDGNEEQRTHANSLYVPKTEFSRTMEALPFHHPKQIIQILPTLRQYAFTTSLLQHTFHSTSPSPPTPSPAVQKSAATTTATTTTTTTGTLQLTPPPTPSRTTTAEAHPLRAPPLQLDTTLSYSPPTPRLTLSFPHPSTTSPLPLFSLSSSLSSSSSTSSAASLLSALMSTSLSPPRPPLRISIDVHPNADLVVGDQNVVDLAPPPPPAVMSGELGGLELRAEDERVKRVARALDVCGDLGVWGEWVRRGVGAS